MGPVRCPECSAEAAAMKGTKLRASCTPSASLSRGGNPEMLRSRAFGKRTFRWTSLRRSAHDQFWLQHDFFRLGWYFRVQNGKGNSGGFLADAAAVLIDAGEWNAKRIVVMKISAANNGDVFRNLYSLIERIIHGSHRQWIIEAEDPIWSRLKAQELAHGFCAALLRFDVSFAFCNDVIFNDLKPCLSKCLLISFHTARPRTSCWAANVGDPLAPDLDQVPGSQPSDHFIC